MPQTPSPAKELDDIEEIGKYLATRYLNLEELDRVKRTKIRSRSATIENDRVAGGIKLPERNTRFSLTPEQASVELSKRGSIVPSNTGSFYDEDTLMKHQYAYRY